MCACARSHIFLCQPYVCAREWQKSGPQVKKNIPKIIVSVYGTHSVLHLAATYANCSLATRISILVCCWCLIFFYIYFIHRCWMVVGGDFSIAKRHIWFFFPRCLCTRAHSLVPFAMQNSILYFYRLEFFFVFKQRIKDIYYVCVSSGETSLFWFAISCILLFHTRTQSYKDIVF